MARGLKKTMGTPFVIDQTITDKWALYHGDSCEVSKGIPDNSLHYSIHSPPFVALYTFSDDPRDVSNNTSDDVFWRHYSFIIKELCRATMPGRLASIHCMNLPTSKLNDGFIGLRDFRGDVIRAFQDAGFIYHSEVCIWKDPVVAMQRTKAIGLLHKQIVKDSALSRMGIADYLVTMRKPGENPEPIAGPITEFAGDISDEEHTAKVRASYNPGGGRTFEDHKSIECWQRYASPVWMDINQSDVLTHKVARTEFDERHISVLQLTVIRRCVDLWSNPGDTVFSPFAGIGSELYVAVEMGRRGLGVELKESYYLQALANMRTLEAKQASPDLDFGAAAE